jgi:Cupin superfamily protein
MNILDSLFSQLPHGHFLDLYFPSRPCQGEGHLSRLDNSLRSPLLIEDAAGFVSAHCHNTDEGLFINVMNTQFSGGIEFVTAIRKELGLRNGQVVGTIAYSPQGKGVRKHYDGNEGLILQLVGSKRWRIAPPMKMVFPGECAGDDGGMPATSKELILQPGSVSFLPRGWWHETVAITPSLSLNLEIHTEVWSSIFSQALYLQLLDKAEWCTPVSLATAIQREAARNRLAEMQTSLERITVDPEAAIPS